MSVAALVVLMLLAPSALWCGEAEQTAPAAAAPALDEDTLAMVKAFLKLPTSEIPAEHIPRFLAVDPDSLPAKLQSAFLAKRIELYTLKQLAEGKKRGGVRMPEADCSIPKDLQGPSAGILMMAGYQEINDLEEDFVMEQTKCTERDLMCEFTLQILAPRKGAKGKPTRRLFLHVNDPVFALVGMFRSNGHVSTHFFGLGGVNCAPRLK
jgi:hypothetical protein